jgi:hypothetical protein
MKTALIYDVFQQKEVEADVYQWIGFKPGDRVEHLNHGEFGGATVGYCGPIREKFGTVIDVHFCGEDMLGVPTFVADIKWDFGTEFSCGTRVLRKVK